MGEEMAGSELVRVLKELCKGFDRMEEDSLRRFSYRSFRSGADRGNGRAVEGGDRRRDDLHVP